MLSMKRCPHTGVVNYFDASEPLFAVGSDNQVYKLNLNNATGDAVGGYTATGSGAID